MGKIVWLGDSVTKGTSYGGVTAAQTFASKVSAAKGYTCINAGVNSDTSAGMVARLSSDVLAYAPAICVVECGLNDWATHVPVGDYQANVANIMGRLKAANIKPIGLSKMQRGSTADFVGQKAYIEALENECASWQVNVIDLFREECASYLYLTTAAFYANYVDAVHLTVTGHQFVTDLCLRPKFNDWW